MITSSIKFKVLSEEFLEEIQQRAKLKFKKAKEEIEWESQYKMNAPKTLKDKNFILEKVNEPQVIKSTAQATRTLVKRPIKIRKVTFNSRNIQNEPKKPKDTAEYNQAYNKEEFNQELNLVYKELEDIRFQIQELATICKNFQRETPKKNSISKPIPKPSEIKQSPLILDQRNSSVRRTILQQALHHLVNHSHRPLIRKNQSKTSKPPFHQSKRDGSTLDFVDPSFQPKGLATSQSARACKNKYKYQSTPLPRKYTLKSVPDILDPKAVQNNEEVLVESLLDDILEEIAQTMPHKTSIPTKSVATNLKDKEPTISICKSSTSSESDLGRSHKANQSEQQKGLIYITQLK